MRVLYAPVAQRNLESIRTFIFTESGNKETADRFIARLVEACDGLAELPSRYPVYSHRRSTRMMPFENYVIFYKTLGGVVRVEHIRHAARRPFTK